MIISHKHKFIFVKTPKTAGTSVEIALSKYCGPEDVLSCLIRKDENMRRELGYPGAQNFRLPLYRYTAGDTVRCLRKRKALHFFNHARALFIRNHVDAETWDNYYKFSFERNPWDKLISMYYWIHKEDPRPSILEYVKSTEFKNFRTRSWNMYTDDSKVIVDKVFRYDQIPQALAEIQQKIGLDELPILPLTKNTQRKDKRPYREILSEECREIVTDLFDQEIDLLGFQW